MDLLAEGGQPTHGISVDAIRASLRGAFPWHRHQEQHPHPGDAERWWENIEALIADALRGIGVAAGESTRVAAAVRSRFVDPSIGWEAFGDAQQALEATAAAGWTNAILSNHVPELPALVAGVGLSTHVDRIFSSAQIGWEKPNPRVFRHALNAYGNPREVWMIGDNPIADIAGAEAVGLRAILVHGADSQEPNGALGLVGAAEIVLGS